MRLIGLAVGVVLSLLLEPLIVEAQQPTTASTAFLLMGSSQSGLAPAFDAFREGLREFGWTENQNIAIEYQWAGENPDRLPELAADLVRHKVDVIISSTAGVLAAQRLTNSIPIMCIADDAVKEGLVTNLARPGANITRCFPVEPTGIQSLGVTVHSVEIRTADDFARAFASIRKGGAEALVVGSGQFLFSHQRKVIESVERPTKFDVIINLKTANAPWANDPPIAACSRRRDHPMMED